MTPSGMTGSAPRVRAGTTSAGPPAVLTVPSPMPPARLGGNGVPCRPRLGMRCSPGFRFRCTSSSVAAPACRASESHPRRSDARRTDRVAALRAFKEQRAIVAERGGHALEHLVQRPPSRSSPRSSARGRRMCSRLAEAARRPTRPPQGVGRGGQAPGGSRAASGSRRRSTRASSGPPSQSTGHCQVEQSDQDLRRCVLVNPQVICDA